MPYDPWPIVNAYFKDYNLASPQIESFNNFVTIRVQDVINHVAPIIIEPASKYNETTKYRYTFTFGSIYISEPSYRDTLGSIIPITPFEARTRNLTYAVPIHVDIDATIEQFDESSDLWIKSTEEHDEYKHISKPGKQLLCMMPIMIGI